jgi:hypothetical protein
MTKFKISILAAVTAVIGFSSCSVEKRVHRRGYHVEWNTSKEKVHNNMAIQHDEKALEASSIAVNTAESGLTKAEIATEVGQASTSVESTQSSDMILNASASFNEKEEVLSTPSLRTFDVKAQENTQTASYTQANSEIKQAESVAEATEGGSKSRITALVLCFFLGALGIHRFYLGYTGIGVLYLLTLGLFGFGVLVDFIRLIIKPGLQPKDGTYENE